MLFLALPVILALAIDSSLDLYSTYNEAEGIYDTELSHVASLMLALLHAEHQQETAQDLIADDKKQINPEIVGLTTFFLKDEQQYEEKVAFRIWKHGKLLFYSKRAANFGDERFNKGFSTQQINGRNWRFYVLPDAKTGYTLELAQRLKIRKLLVNDILTTIFSPLLMLLPIILLITWMGLRAGLKPLLALSEAVKRRSAKDLTPIPTERLLTEITPLVYSINGLLADLDYELEKERRFTDFAAHELRTPIAVLKTQAQTALVSTNDAERRMILEAQVQAANRATQLVDQLLALARLEQGDIPMEKLPLNDIVRSVVQEKRPLAAQEQIALRFEQQAPLAVRGNKELIAIILSNLIENAIKYTPAQGDVLVSLSAQDQTVLLAVSDTGHGIPEDKLPYVTEHFYRVPGQRQPGAGLGLAIAKRAAELIDAKLALQNKSAGGGLEVLVQFPAIFS